MAQPLSTPVKRRYQDRRHYLNVMLSTRLADEVRRVAALAPGSTPHAVARLAIRRGRGRRDAPAVGPGVHPAAARER
jgi:hypothetical protein